MTEHAITRTQAWLESLRPKTLPLAFSAIVVGTTLAWQQGYFDPWVALLALMFVLTLPFTGLEAISQRVSAAGLMSTLTLLLLLLMAIVREPQKEALPYPGALRYLIKCSLIVAPIYMLIAGWSLWVRIQQYGWTPERLYGVLVVVVLLVWSFGYLASILRRGRNPLELQGLVILGVSLLALGLLVLLSSPY